MCFIVQDCHENVVASLALLHLPNLKKQILKVFIQKIGNEKLLRFVNCKRQSIGDHLNANSFVCSGCSMQHCSGHKHFYSRESTLSPSPEVTGGAKTPNEP